MYGSILCSNEAQNNKKALRATVTVILVSPYRIQSKLASYYACCRKKERSRCLVLFSCCRLYSPVSE